MKQTLQEMLHFTRRERRSVFYLLGLIFFFLLLPFISSFFIPKKIYDHSEFEAEIALWESEMIIEDSIQRSKYYKNYKKKEYKNNRTKKDAYADVKITPFPFNPNKADRETLKDLGLPDKIVNIFINFRKKGGKFYKKEDLKNVYGMREEWYGTLASYVRISKEKKTYPKKDYSKKQYQSKEDNRSKITESDPIAAADIPKNYDNNSNIIQEEKPKTKKKSKPKYKTVKVDINTASASEFQKIYGVGPAFSKRMVEHREKLGGYYNVQQISEIYGMVDSTFQKIKPSLLRGNPQLKKININTATTDELKVHPYIKWKVANAIVKYRKNNGDYSSIEALKKNYAVSEELYQKLAPYLSVE